MSATQTHATFIGEPIKNKPANELPGIGTVLGERLSKAGYGTARKVLGQYLLLDEDENKFKDWLKKESNANESQATACFNGIKEWAAKYL